MKGKALTFALLLWTDGVLAQEGGSPDRFFWHSCIAFHEFHKSPDIPTSEAEIAAYRKLRETNGEFQTVVRYVCGTPLRPDCEIDRFHDEIDEARALLEEYYLNVLAQNSSASRSEFIVHDVCMLY